MIILLAFSVFVGGASREHELRLAIVELVSLPVLCLAVMRIQRKENRADHGFALVLLLACVGLPLLQLLPLPPAVWESLPGRNDLVIAQDLAGRPHRWVTLSLTPDRTWQSVLALIPPISAFLAVLALSIETKARLAQALVAGGLASVALGAAQVVSGDDLLYPWQTTAAGSMVGFFANRNHLATFCLISLPFAVVLAAKTLRKNHRNPSRNLWLAGLYAGLIVFALAAIRSRAGISILPIVLGLSFLSAWIAAGRGRPKLSILVMVGLGVGACAGVALFAIGPIIARFDDVALHEGRFDNWPTVMQAAEAFLPIGSGIGSFDTVYRSFEPIRLLEPTFFNQAHNDYLETWLETGWLGAGLIVGFLIWFGRRSWSAWAAEASTPRDLQRAASIGLLVIILHSAVDYPLRTETIAVVFAILCGLLETGQRSGQLSRARPPSGLMPT